MPIQPANTAVLFIDYQVDVCVPGGRMVGQDAEALERFKAVRATGARLLTHLRRRRDTEVEVPYAHVGHGFSPGYPELRGARLGAMDRYVMKVGAHVRGEPGSAFAEGLEPGEGEPVFWKHTIDVFRGTDVAAWLNRRNVENVALAGVVTHYAILAAALSAYDLGFQPVVLSDCCTSGGLSRHEVTLEILGPLAEIMTAAEFVEALKAG